MQYHREKEDPHTVVKSFLTKIPQQSSGKRKVFSTNDTGTNADPYLKKMNYDLYLTPYTNLSQDGFQT